MSRVAAIMDGNRERSLVPEQRGETCDALFLAKTTSKAPFFNYPRLCHAQDRVSGLGIVDSDREHSGSNSERQHRGMESSQVLSPTAEKDDE
jgi:hypothetical protein